MANRLSFNDWYDRFEDVIPEEVDLDEAYASYCDSCDEAEIAAAGY